MKTIIIYYTISGTLGIHHYFLYTIKYIRNNKAEYNRCALPRLTAKLGERDLDKWREEDRREMEQEATIKRKYQN